MKVTSQVKRFMIIVVSMILIITAILAVYTGSIPEKYSLKAGDASPYDITAPRSIPDKKETDLRAVKAAAEVADVMLPSDQISSSVKTQVALFFDIVAAARTAAANPTPVPAGTSVAGKPTPAPTKAPVVNSTLLAQNIALQLNQELKIVLSQNDALTYAQIPDQRLESIKGHVQQLTNLIMAETVDITRLKNQLSAKMANLAASLTFYQEDSGIIERTLGLLLKPNVVFDKIATENSRQAAYDKIQNNPVMIDKGSRIVSLGDIITDDTYALLLSLSLIESGVFDIPYFIGIALLLIMLICIAGYYIIHYENDTIHTPSDYAALVLALLTPLIISVYLTRQAPLAPPVYFAAVLITAYFGLRASIVLSLCLSAAILPMTNFNPVFLIVAMCGSLVAALFTKGISRKNNYAFIILATAVANFIITLAYGLLQKDSWAAISVNCVTTALSGTLSVIAAIGIMPLFEMLFNTVSPLRLIELSQPGHPLLRRLFVEAPGSSQHSMMVANLADAAASAIGANTLLVRVGAYYHDIGKLENPLMFTENQEGENPHDTLSPEKSAEMILAHPDAGVRIGRRYRLPTSILRIIHEHHGSTSQAFFYQKALQTAEDEGQPEPDVNLFRYRCPIPSSRESAVIMLADSVEAAMKSTGVNNLDEAEKLIRRVIKVKNEQDQLINSELSYRNVETLVQAFLQVYAGHFHERVKYPDERSLRQPTS